MYLSRPFSHMNSNLTGLVAIPNDGLVFVKMNGDQELRVSFLGKYSSVGMTSGMEMNNFRELLMRERLGSH